MTASTHRKPPAAALAVIIATGVVLVQALLVPLFAAPAANLAPRDLPVVVAGPATAAGTLADRLATVQPGAFEVTTVADAAAADDALRDRKAYAAFVVGPGGVSLHTASAASPAVAALLTGAAQQLGQGGQIDVVDVVATDPDDPRGAGFAAGFLPLALAALLAGVAFALAVRGRGPRLVGLLGFSALAGLVGAAVLQYWLGILPANYLANATAIGLLALAVSAATTGLAAVLGRAGLAVAALLIFIVGNPLSAVAAAPELLPVPWGTVGSWLPVGAGGTLLRSAAYFDWAGTGPPLAILGTWSAAGLLLVLAGRPAAPAPAPVPGRHPDVGEPITTSS